MKDFPVFPTEHGVASLTLREIPYRQTAYIEVQDVQLGELPALIEECVGFCRACGAERIFAGGRGDFPEESYHASVLEMRMNRLVREDPEACLWPVTEQTVSRFRTIYNEAMADVDFAATLTAHQEREIADCGGAYFVHRDGDLLGIGWMQEEALKAIVSLKPGMGQTVADALFSVTPSEQIRLEVASTNHRAIRLYERMGFLRTGEVMRWYRVFPAGSTKS